MKNKKIKYALNFLVVVLFIILMTKLDYKSIFMDLKAISKVVLVSLILMQLLEMGLLNYQNQRLAKKVGHKLSFVDMFFVTSIGHVFDAITPGGGVGGEAVKIMKLKQHMDIPLAKGTAMVLAQKIMSLCALIVLVIVAFFYLTISNMVGVPFILEIFVYISLVGVLAFVVYVFYHPATFIKKCEKIKNEKIRKALVNFLYGVKDIARDKKECIIEMLISGVIWFVYPIKLYMLVTATGMDIGFITVYVVIVLANAIATVPIFPGGMLGFEVAMTSMLALFGVAGDTSLFITTLYRFITFWFVIFVSVLYILGYKIYKMIKK